MIGIFYFIVIVLANSVGSVSGMGGGVIIKPVLDLVGAHDVASISFYSAVAVFTMSIVSTTRQVKTGAKFDWKLLLLVSFGAIVGGFSGNIAFDSFLTFFGDERVVNLIQIVLTIITLLFAFLYAKYNWKSFQFKSFLWYLGCGFILGFLASLLGIGGGPINVSLLMLLFAMPIKQATFYSIATIFFSQLSKLVTIASTTGFVNYDLSILYYVIPAAIIGGLVGARLSNVLSEDKVLVVFQFIIMIVLMINIFNGIMLFT